MVHLRAISWFIGIVCLVGLAMSAVGAEHAAGEPSGIQLPGNPDANWFSLGVDYTLATDYIWRGQNFSEYSGEGREKLNHQLNIAGSVETPIGTFNGGVWLEWFAGQQSLDPGSSSNLQEVDYTLSYSNSCGAVSFEAGWIAYVFPQASGDDHTTYETFISLGLDDSTIFGTEESVLNPTATWYMDLDLNANNSWFELGISHDFPLGEVEWLKFASLEHMTISPSLTLGIDNRFISTSTQLGNLEYGLECSYDVSSALDLPEQMGEISISVFLNYSQGLAETLNDEFYGGLTLSIGL